MSCKHLFIIFIISSGLADEIIVKMTEDFISEEIAGHVDVCNFVICPEAGNNLVLLLQNNFVCHNFLSSF